MLGSDVSSFSPCDYYNYDTLNDINFTQGNLKILHLNIRSIQTNTTHLLYLLDCLKNANYEIDTLLLWETYMTKHNKNKCTFSGCTLKECVYREQGKGGVILIHLKECSHYSLTGYCICICFSPLYLWDSYLGLLWSVNYK